LIRKKPLLLNESDLTQELQGLMDQGQAKGLMSGEESDMLHGVLELKDTEIYDIMIPRTEVRFASINSTLHEMITLVAECGHTRIPLYKDSIDEVVGILHAKDILRLWGQDPSSKIPQDLIRNPYFVPENKKVSELLKEFKQKRTHLAIVTDEYGGTAGIITIEDIIEEIVGEIMDEHDLEHVLISAVDENSVMVDARLELEKLGEYFGINLPEGDFVSVGGFVIHLLGRIPRKDEKVLFDNLEMIIHSADERKIKRILVTLRDPSTPITKEDPH
ncbi:MAG: hemolysin family protein, partial [Pseudomonadota bacterium]